jgi:hypothetical protein
MIWAKAILVGFLIGLSGTWLLQRNGQASPNGESAVFLAPGSPAAPGHSRFRNLLLMEGTPFRAFPSSRLPQPV